MKFTILSSLLFLVFTLLALVHDAQAIAVSDVFSTISDIELAMKAFKRLLGGVYEERISNIRRADTDETLGLYYLKADGDMGSIFQFMVDDMTIVDNLLAQDDSSSPKFKDVQKNIMEKSSAKRKKTSIITIAGPNKKTGYASCKRRNVRVCSLNTEVYVRFTTFLEWDVEYAKQWEREHRKQLDGCQFEDVCPEL